ncbi:MAG TPA: CHAT domain-containing tetratricopeptide repeat protein, partial [Pyrinomonadaceae bacterium]|nr:CHAT domain-containing tetratricopeptide repeat protein [Pyrinomonadaceae bacterium]
LAAIYASRGLHKLAAGLYQKTLKFYESSGDLRGQSLVLNAYGDSLLEQQKKQEALETYSRALEFSERVNDPGVVISTFYNVARAHLALGSPEAARPFIQKSISLIESLRANVASPEYRASYFSGVQENYELCIHVLMQLEKLKPGQGFGAEALAVSERARARLLVDLVSQARSTPRAGVANELLERERRLSESLRSQVEYRMTLSPNQKAELAEVDDDLIELRVQYQALLVELSQQQPHLFSIEQAPSPDLQRIQNELRGSDTMLLEYSLGESSSYLWAVTSDSVKFYELPSAKTIEDAAREYYELVTTIQGTEEQVSKDYQSNIDAAHKLLSEKAAYLSRTLLGPLAGQLGTRRLLVVLDGALQYIPLDALPVSGATNGTLLVDTNEVVVLPSMSTLIAIRAKQNRSRSTGKLVAVIADPVFSGSDARVQFNANSSATNQFNRLTHTSEEADAIGALAPWGTTLMVKGFDASRETAMSSDVAQYQIIHFATHAVPNEEHPELSSVVLTMVDRNGEKADGLMPLHDIYSLDLAAELTVLSACQTALGKNTKGEGLVGLTHGFMSAGSKSVVASLWKVDDRATAFLMANFYEAMLQQGMSPAAALRSAKLKMKQDKRWSEPYFWAGFVIQGEYENHIEVDHHSTLFGLMLLVLLALVAAAVAIFQRRRFSASHSS